MLVSPVLKPPGGEFVEGGVIAQTKGGCSTGCARGNLQGETVYYVPINSTVVSPKAGTIGSEDVDENLLRDAEVLHVSGSVLVMGKGMRSALDRWYPILRKSFLLLLAVAIIFTF